MEGVQTVDVSWLHHSQKALVPGLWEGGSRDNFLTLFSDLSRSKSTSAADKPGNDAEYVPSQPKSHRRSRSSSNPARATPPPHTSEVNPNQPPKNDPAPVQAKPTTAEKTEEQKPSATSPSRKTDPKPIGRRNSWISSLSSKFSSGTTPPSQSSLKEEEKKDDFNSSASTSPKGPSFLHNALRKFSSNSGGLPKLNPNGSVCPRRVMNIDQNRHRCKIADLNQAKLNRVAFCVDVEIAGISHRDDDEEAPPTNQLRQSLPESSQKSKKADLKAKEQGEAGALKDPQATLAQKEGAAPVPIPVPVPADIPAVAAATPPATTPDAAPTPAAAPPSIPVSEQTAVDAKPQPSSPPKEVINNNPSTGPTPNAEGTDPTRKQEKKKRSEAERKERKERKRRQAVANGTVPLQLGPEHDEEYTQGPAAPPPGASRSKTQGHPTTDPVRIYRRCCQLRETPVLKRVVDEISKPSSTLAESPGTVAALDLSNFPMTSQDLATFSDWLAVVPVRKLLLENCSLTDASVRAILAALLSTKTIEQMRYRRKRSRRPEAPGSNDHERYGVVEKLSLKNNPKIGREGWRHISLFVHLSKSLKAIDLSGIHFPRGQVAVDGSGATGPNQTASADVSAVFASALAERFGGDHLEELLMSECCPSVDAVKQICQAGTKMGLRRLGFANNGLTREGLGYVAEYLKAGQCEGLDLGGNAIKDDLDLITAAIEPETPLYALSLADCGLTPSVITTLLQSLAQIHNLRFIDFSHNRELFSTDLNSLGAFRRFLPKMTSLKRFHLADVNLSPDHVIGLAEVLPECPSLCHLNILENPQIVSLASTTDPVAQEEACAVYASMMAAVRVSRTIIAVDIDIPSAENNEVVKALASQIVAYSLRNLEGGAIAEELSGSSDSVVDVPVPEILQHIVGNVIPSEEPCDDEDDTAPDADYVIGGTGVVKALGVCLKNLDHHGLDALGEHSAPASGTSTPRRRRSRAVATKRPRDMSKNLLESARNIRARIQSALIREDRAGNDANYRRLQFLDITLHRMIQRFEDEYPETRVKPPVAPAAPLPDAISQHSGDDDAAVSITASGNLNGTQLDEAGVDEEDTDQYAVRHSRTSSMTSIHSRAMTSQEGHIHRLGQNIRRDFLKPSLAHSDGDEDSEDNSSRIAALRQKLDRLHEEQCLSQFDDFDSDMAYNHLGTTVDELFAAQQQDAESFERFKQSQIAAQINSGVRPRDIVEPKSDSWVSESKPS
ncbi:Leucine-rich repeat ribonuclease inhibitor subtype [Penicillium sp. DV-2018c]|nr:Leucine-rich repeat ribonuclease inhibitor subtype [Penicillium sp. DV-2018c]